MSSIYKIYFETSIVAEKTGINTKFWHLYTDDMMKKKKNSECSVNSEKQCYYIASADVWAGNLIMRAQFPFFSLTL